MNGSSLHKEQRMNELIKRLNGANMDIDLAMPKDLIAWEQNQCPWNEAEKTNEHKCAVKNISLCRYFCGVEYMDTLLCCYPHPNPFAGGK
jgi:hypothetical protein